MGLHLIENVIIKYLQVHCNCYVEGTEKLCELLCSLCSQQEG